MTGKDKKQLGEIKSVRVFIFKLQFFEVMQDQTLEVRHQLPATLSGLLPWQPVLKRGTGGGGAPCLNFHCLIISNTFTIFFQKER